LNLLAVSLNLISVASDFIKECFINERLNHLYSSVTDNHDSVLLATRVRWFDGKALHCPLSPSSAMGLHGQDVISAPQFLIQRQCSSSPWHLCYL